MSVRIRKTSVLDFFIFFVDISTILYHTLNEDKLSLSKLRRRRQRKCMVLMHKLVILDDSNFTK